MLTAAAVVLSWPAVAKKACLARNLCMIRLRFKLRQHTEDG